MYCQELLITSSTIYVLKHGCVYM